MTKLIIDATTGTILDISNCYVVETATLTEEETDLLEGSDSEISLLAQNKGKQISKIGNDTGWGDNSYRHTVSYSPMSLKDEAFAYVDGGIYSEGDAEFEALNWVVLEASHDELATVSDFIMNCESTWHGYGETVIEAIAYVYKTIKEQK